MSRFSADRLDPANYGERVDALVLQADLGADSRVSALAVGRYFEHARVVLSMFRFDADGPGFSWRVARVDTHHLDGGRIGELVQVGTRLMRMGRSSLTLEQAAWQGDTVLALSEVVMVRVRDGRAIELSPALLAAVEQGRPDSPRARW